MLLRRRAMFGAGAESLEGKLGSVAVGKIVRIADLVANMSTNLGYDVSADAGDFILVHQGNPDKYIYDPSCNGSWLLLKNAIPIISKTYDSNKNNYAESDVARYLSRHFDDWFNDAVSKNILTVKIPYYYNGTLYSLDNGFQCKSFLPAMVEYGYNTKDSETAPNANVPTDGTKLEYFKDCAPSYLDEDVKRECDLRHWHRSPNMSTMDNAWNTSAAGRASTRNVATRYAMRPMIIMNKYTVIDGSNIIVSE